MKPRVLVLMASLGCLGCPSGSSDDAGAVDAPHPNDVQTLLDAQTWLDASSPSDALAPDAAAAIDGWVALLEAGDETAIARAMHTQAWAGGWPIQEDGRWLFVSRHSDRPAQVSLVGEINGWATSRNVALRSPGGLFHWVLMEASAFTSPALGAKYKWFVAGDYRAPLEATQYGFDENGRFGWVQAPSDVAHLEQFPDHASAFLTDVRSVRVFVPARLDAPRARTLLLHDGQNVFHPDAAFGGWRVDAALASRGNVLAVAIDNAPDRMDAYTQVEDDIGGGVIGGRASLYLQLVRDEVLPFVRTRYGVEAHGGSLAMMGSSLGGLVTLFAASGDFEDMACGAALSSTVGWGSIGGGRNGSSTLLGTWRGAPTAIYVDSGGDDGGGCRDSDADGVNDDGDDSDNYCVNVQLRGVLGMQGYAAANLTYAWQMGAGHNEAAWASRAGNALDACGRMGWTSP